jgi:hypothetical protein
MAKPSHGWKKEGRDPTDSNADPQMEERKRGPTDGEEES